MSHKRRITPDTILDAAERVASRLGAVGLSIDEVAKEAGISKSHVVYDFKTKDRLLAELVRRRLDIERAKVEQYIIAQEKTSNPALFARIDAVSTPASEEEKAAMLSICTATSSNLQVQDLIRKSTHTDVKEIVEKETRPLAATLAYLALVGLQCLEAFDFWHWPEDERAKIIEGIRTLYSSFPENQPLSDTI